MSISVTVDNRAPQGQGVMAYCTVASGGSSHSLAVYVSPPTLRDIAAPELDAYLQARALVASNQPTEALTIVTPYATGQQGSKEDTRNWAARWRDGEILS